MRLFFSSSILSDLSLATERMPAMSQQALAMLDGSPSCSVSATSRGVFQQNIVAERKSTASKCSSMIQEGRESPQTPQSCPMGRANG